VSLSYSPLRYPGGKQILFSTLSQLIKQNGFSGGYYAEPYAGGAGAALALLFGEHVDRLLLNDADPAIYSFWNFLLTDTEGLLRKIRTVPLTIKEWKRQRAIYARPSEVSGIELGFSAFYLNRCNRSGIIPNAGVIGGLNQTGKWKIDARFNRDELAKRITRIARYKDRIEMHNLDAIQFLTNEINTVTRAEKCFVYLDPPYYMKGSQLYLSYYEPDDHTNLAKYLRSKAKFSWVLTYDDTDEIRTLYSGLNVIPFKLRYSASESRNGNEIFISKRNFPSARRSLSTIAS
jgi:DNA adenine methylase